VKLSNSTIKTFQSCRRKWWLTYDRQLTPRAAKAVTGVALLGTRIHTALEAYYGYGVPVLDALEALYADAREQFPEAYTELNAEASYARIMATGYLEWVAAEGVDERYEVVSTEQVISVDLPGTPVEMLVKLDQVLRDRNSGALRIRDFKTVGSLSKADGLARDQQMRFYDLALSLSTDEWVDGALFTMILRSKRTAKATPPFYAVEEINYNRHDRESTALRVGQVAQEMGDVTQALRDGADPRRVAYANNNGECEWSCPFAKICPMFDDGSNTEGALAGMFEHRNPYGYYGNDLVNKVLTRTGAAPAVVE
jgi:PD-(D/E)XK nuclease superfamily